MSGKRYESERGSDENGGSRSVDPLVGPLDVETALRYVLDCIRRRQTEIRAKQDMCSELGVEEARASLEVRHMEINDIAEIINYVRRVNYRCPNAKTQAPT